DLRIPSERKHPHSFGSAAPNCRKAYRPQNDLELPNFVYVDDTSRLVNLGEIVEEDEEEQAGEVFANTSVTSSHRQSSSRVVALEENAVSSRPTSKPQRSPSAPPLRRKPEEEEEKDHGKYGRKSLDDSSLSLLGLAAWADPFAVLRRLYPGPPGDPRQGGKGYNDFAKAKPPEPISVSASNEEKWAAACQEPRTILEAAGYKEPYELDVECGAAGVAVPLPAKDPLDLDVTPDISEKEVYHAQRAYAKAVMRISNSYYAGGEEPASFAIVGSRGWSDVGFDNHQIEIADNVAIASGKCYLTSAETRGITEADFTIGYKKDELGKVGIFFQNSSIPLDPDAFDAKPLVSEEAVQKAQEAWASAIKQISKTYLEGGDYVAAAAEAAGELYGYGHSEVLFKPTKAAEAQFRPSASDAMSYFVGSDAVEGGYAEDTGFAINGGKGWSDVVFENHKTNRTGNIAIAMGNYYFTCAQTGNQTKVEYTFGYKTAKDGKLRIFLHHSSVPFDPETSFVISEEEVQKAQEAWASAIKEISKTYLGGGDYVTAATQAAGELYGYGHSEVLFKPTKASEAQFRPSANDALSYFVGHQAVEGGSFENHQTKLNGPIAIAMGNYHFTCAATGDKTKVEYTFGYKKNVDGKLRIFLHHSSVPYVSAGSPTVVANLISEEEVHKAQEAWASAIKQISKTYLEGGDYVAAAAEAAGELYGYGHSEVLFKPTKAAEAQFRPSASDAMSYFVGSDAVEGGHAEDSKMP
ncbi:JNK, partial [Symbiodinium microadriaticum]